MRAFLRERSMNERRPDRTGDRDRLLVWAVTTEKPPLHSNVVLWSGRTRRAGVRSLIDYLETHAEEVRARYLAWVQDFGDIRVLGRPVRERFRLSERASFWPHAVFVEQSLWKQASMEPLLRLFALERILRAERPAAVELAGSDRKLVMALKSLCERSGIEFSWNRSHAIERGKPRGFLRSLPRIVQGALALGHFAARHYARPVRRASKWNTGHTGHEQRSILICGPLFDPAGKLETSGIFSSQYWTRLPTVLVRGDYKIQWLHYFHSHDRVTTIAAARARVRGLNSASTDDAHALVEDSATAGALLQVSLWWVKICIESYLYSWEIRRKLTRLTGMNCWSLIRDDWAKAFRGHACVQGLFFIACFDRALRGSSHYQEGLYLMENQGWERALAQAWRKYGHGRLTGAAHSTVRFWDLRYHCDPRRYSSTERLSTPGPDVVALNGPEACRQYLSTCEAREEVLRCEALRYLHLLSSAQSVGRPPRGVTVTLLVLGDYSVDQSTRLLRLVEEARQRARVALRIRVKSHPACPIDVNQFPGMEFLSTAPPVAQLVRSADWVLASNSTSAVLDAYLQGARLLIHNDGMGVNLSPLRGASGVAFVGDAVDLTEALEGPSEEFAHGMADRISEFFHIEDNLRVWSAFFGISVSGAGSKVLCEVR